MAKGGDLEIDDLGRGLRALRGSTAADPDVTVVVPVNAQGDLVNVRSLLGDVARYDGRRTVEVVLVVNNFPAAEPPPEIDDLRETGATVLGIPDVRRPGEAVGFSARIPGIRAASTEFAVLFDADCRVPNPTALLDWYAEQFHNGAHAAYTPVAYYDYADAVSLRLAFGIHHATRWIKRNILRIPTTRGSNYAVRCDTILRLYDDGFLADEMNVGPTVKRMMGRVAYGSRTDLTVYTSGRMFSPGWRRMLPYFLYRLRYNLRVLPVRSGVASVTGRENDPVRRYRDNRPVREDASRAR